MLLPFTTARMRWNVQGGQQIAFSFELGKDLSPLSWAQMRCIVDRLNWKEPGGTGSVVGVYAAGLLG